MKILYLADAKSIHTQRWAKHFAEQGYNVSIISFRSAQIKNVRVYVISPVLKLLGKINYLLKIPYIKKLIEQISPDLIHSLYLTSYGGIAGRAMKSIPLILSALGSDVLVSLAKISPSGLFLKWFVGPSIIKSDAITSESKIVEKTLIRKLKIDQKKIYRFPWGIDTKIFYTGYSKKKLSWKKKLKISNNTNIVLSNRGIKKLYNIDIIIKSIPYVLKNFPNTIFIFVTGVKNANYYKYLKRLIKELDVAKNVRFIENYLTSIEMASLLNLSKVFVSIPSSESLPISVMEAMACETIPIVSNIEGNQEILEDGAQIKLIEKKNEKQLSLAIVDVLRLKKDKCENIKKINSCLAQRIYSWQESAKEMEKIYIKTITKKND